MHHELQKKFKKKLHFFKLGLGSKKQFFIRHAHPLISVVGPAGKFFGEEIMSPVSATVVGTSRRFLNVANLLTLAVVAASAGLGGSARGDTYASNGATTLNVASSWIDLTNPGNTGIGLPGATDIAAFDSHAALVTATTFSLGAPTSWQGLLIQNPGAAIFIDTGSNTLTLGSSGIDMSAAAQSVTLAPSTLFLGADQTWNVNTGQTLTINAPTLDTGGKALTIQGAGNVALPFAISNSGSLVLSGTGVVTIANFNSYSGGTTLNSGTLVVNNSGALGTGPLTIAGGTMNNTSGAAITLTTSIPVNINGSFTYTGGAALNVGTGAVTLGATPTITVNGTGAAGVLTLGGVISGSGFGITKAGGGSLVLSGANTYTGPVTINAGVLNFNSMSALGAGTVLNFGGGTLQYASGNGADISTDTVTFTGNATIDTGGNSITFAHSIGNGGAGGFTKTGTGSLVLAAVNSYSGNTTVSGSNATVASVLGFQSLASLGSGSAINISNGTLQYLGVNTADLTTRAVTVTGTLAGIDINGNSVSYANAISGTGTLTISSTAGPASFTLNVPNEYKGTIAANTGVTFVMANAASLASASVTLNSGSALNFTTATAVTLGGLGGAQNLALTNANSQAVTLTLGGNNQGGSYSGVLSDGGSNLPITKIGTGNQTFSGQNTFGGNIVVDGGVLSVAVNATTTNQYFYSGSANPGTLIMNGGEFTINSVANTTTYQKFGGVTIGSGQSDIYQPGRTSSSHPSIVLGAITRTVGATVNFDPAAQNGATGTADATTGTFTTNTNGPSGVLGGWATSGNDWAQNNNRNGNATNNATGQQHIYGISSNLSTAAYVANTWSNNTNNTDVTANMTATANATTGTLRFNTAAGLTVTTSGANVIATGGILVGSTVGANTATIAPIDSNSTLTSGNGSDLIVSNYDSIAGGSFNIQTPIVNNGVTPIALTKSGVGTLTLSGNNTFTGGVYLNEGAIVVGNAGALNSSSPNAVYFASGILTGGNTTSPSGTLTLNGNNLTVSQLSTANAFVGTPIIQNVNATAATLTVNGATPSTFNGTIVNGAGGALSLAVSGGSSLTLSGSNSYAGNTTITGGSTLILSGTGSISNSTVINVDTGSTLSVGGVIGGFSVAGINGQILGGNGTITGSVNLPANAILSPGFSNVGTLTIGSLTLNSGSIINFDFGSGVNDRVNVVNSNGLVVNGANGTINVNMFQGGSPFGTSGTYNLFQYSGSLGGNGTLSFADANLPFGTTATFGTSAGFVTVTLASNTSQYPNWNLSGGGSWNVAGNWTPSGVPNGQGQVAYFGSAITGPSTVTLDGTQTVGTIAFNNANSYTIATGTGGSLVLDNGTKSPNLIASLGDHTISANVILNSNLSASITAGSVTISGTVSEGSAGKTITKSGAGALILSGANGYTGGTFIGAGTVQVGNNTALGTGSVSFTGSSTLQAGASVSLANNISVAAGTTATIDTQANTLGLSGIVSSADPTASFSKIGSGTLVVTGTNTFTGNVNVNGGTLQLGDGVTNGSFAAANITTVNSILAINTVGAVTVPNTITGTGSVVQMGANTVTLTGANTFSGDLNIQSGTVSLGTATTTDPAGAGNITMADATTLLLPGFNANTGPTYSTIPNNVIVANGANVTIGGQPRATFAGGVFGNGTINYEVQYVRGLISGDWSNFSGAVNLVPTTANGATTPGGDFRINGSFDGSHAAFNVPAGVNVYTLATGGIIAFGDLTGNGTLMLTDNNVGTLSVGNTEIAGQTTTFTGTIGDATVGRATHFTKNGAGTLDLAGTNGFTGTVTVNQGTLTFAGASSTPTATSGISVAANATLDLNNYNPTITPATNVTSIGITGGGTIGSSSTASPSTITYRPGVTSTFSGNIVDSINGGTQTVALSVTYGTLILSGTNTYTGGTTIDTYTDSNSTVHFGTLQLGAGGTTGSVVGPITDNSTLAFNRSDNLTFSQLISGTGNVTQIGPGILALSNPGNTFTGATVTGGTLQMVPAVQFGNGNVALTVTAGTFDLNGTSTTIGSLSGAAAGVVDNVSAGGTATLTTGSLNADVTFAGTIQNTTGSVALVKNGTGNLTLSGGTSTYTGGTTLNAGGLWVTNTTGSATGAGNVTLNGGTLGGTGIIAGKIVPGSGPHTISPGANTANSIGTLTVGGLSTNANTTLSFDLTAPGGTNDLIAVTGNVSLNGGTVAIASLPITGNTSLGNYKVMTYTGTLSGSRNSVNFPANSGNVIYTLDIATPGVINIHKGWLGDASDDGHVDLTDLSTVLNNFGSANSSWNAGNFDGAATIDLTDLSAVLNNFGTSIPANGVATTGGATSATATPEPASLALMLSSSLLLLRRRRAGI